MRYETPDDEGETRRARNDNVGEFTPEFTLPSEGKYLWDWYIHINESVSRILNGVCTLIPPSEYHAWSILTGNIVYSFEYDIMMSMDRAFCDETNKELQNIRSKQEEAQRREVEQARKK